MLDPFTQCQQQVLAFFRDLDENRYEAMAERLAPDGVWHRQGQLLQGREAVLAALARRAPTMRILHLFTNLLLDRLDADTCELRGYMLIVRHDAGVALDGPAPLSGIESIRNHGFTLRRHGERWLIAALRPDEPSFSMAAGAISR